MSAQVKVGDRDPVTAAAGDHEPLCSEHNAALLYCTRPEGHDGDHVACVPGCVAAAVWS